MARTTATIPVSADTRQLERDIQVALSKDFKLKGLNEKAFTQPLGRITGATSEFQKSLDASNARVIAFGASAGIIYAVQQSFTDLIRTTIEVEKSLKDINVILNASEGTLKSFSNQLFEVAKNTGQTFKEVASAATEFARQGLSVEETLKRTNDALILTRLSGLDTVSSVEALTAAVNSFSKVGLNSTEVINKLANVDAAFAVSSADLANAIQRVGSSALDAGVSFDELLAIVTSVQQTTARGGAVIGNSLKTIFTRIQRQDTLDALQGLGIQVKDLEGNTLPALKILEELAKRFDNLGDSQRSAIAEQVGGVFQINILKAALGDLSKEYSIYQNALDVANTSTDEAIKRNQELNETVSALLNKTLANITRVGAEVGETAFKPTISNLLNLANKGLENISLDTSTTGGKIGKGIVEGIGTFIAGPGVILLTAVLGKLFLNLGKFALDSLKNLLSLNKASEQRSLIQTRILEVLSKEPQLVASILSKQTSLLQVENQILSVIKSQTLERQRSAAIASQLSGNLMSRGVTVSRGGMLTTKTKSEGYIPEIYGALAGGYVPGNIKEMYIPGEGKVIYNTAEQVKKFPGASQPAIIPPENSRAGKKYKINFTEKLGFDPYKSDGFIPNFAANPFQQAQRYITEANKYKMDVEELIQRRGYNISSEVRKELDSLKAARPALLGRERPKEIVPFKAQSLGIVGVTGRRGVINAQTSFRTLGYANDPRIVRFEGIQARTLEDLKNSTINSKNAFSGEINKLFLDPLANLATSIFGPISPDPKFRSTLSSSARKRGINLFPAGTEGSIFEAAVNLGTKRGGALERAFDQDAAQKPFDFEESSPPSTAFNSKFGFNPPVIKADAKRTITPEQAREIIDKAYRDATTRPLLPNPKLKNSGFIPNFADLQRAIEAEIAMGGKPVLDLQKGIGLYIRDGSTQKNFNDVKKDHPEGIKKAIKNSKILQSSFNKGFVPNFAKYSVRDPATGRFIKQTETIGSLAEQQASASVVNSASKAASAMNNFGSKLEKLNSKLETTVLTMAFLAPTLIQTAAQFDSQDAKTQAGYNTLSQATTYGFLGSSAGSMLAPLARVIPQLRAIAPFLPLLGGGAGAYGGYKIGKSQENEMMKRERYDLLNKELGILQDRFNQRQGATQQIMPLVEQYRRTLSMKGEPDVKQANLDLLYEKIVDSVSVFPEQLQAGILEKIKSGRFEELGGLLAESFAQGAAEIQEKNLEAYFEGLKQSGGIKSKAEAEEFAKSLIDVRSKQTGLRYTTNLAKTEEGRRRIDEVITDLNNLSELSKNTRPVNLRALGPMQTTVDSQGQITMARQLQGQEGTLGWAKEFVKSMIKDAEDTLNKPYTAKGAGITVETGGNLDYVKSQAADTLAFLQRKQGILETGASEAYKEAQMLADDAKKASQQLETFVDIIKKLYTDVDGKVAPEFENVAKEAVQVAISSGDLNAGVRFVVNELRKTKAGASKLTEEIFNTIETTQDFIERYRADMRGIGKLNSEEIRKYIRKVGQNEMAPDLLLGQDYEKQLRQLNMEILNQDERDRVSQQIAEQERILAEKVKQRIITEDQYRNALLALIESEKTKSKRDQGLMFADQYKQERQQQREQRLLSGKAVSDGRKALDVGDAFFTEFDYRTEDLYRDLQTGATDTARTIKSEFANAFQSIVDNSQTAEDAFRNMALNIARRIQQLALEAATNQIFSSLTRGFGLGDLFKFGSGGFAKFGYGGEVKKYAYGGEVEGGSGYKDDILTFLTGGEYIIRKSAVNKYGKDFLNRLNQGSIPRFAEGGFKPSNITRDSSLAFGMGGRRGPSVAEIEAEEALRLAGPYTTDLPGENVNTGGGFSYEGKANFVYNDTFKPTSGRFEIDPQLSAAALYDENNPQRDVLRARYDNLQSYIAEGIDLAERNREEEARVNEENRERKAMIDAMNKAQRANFNQSRKNQLLGGAIQAGGIIGAGLISTFAVPALSKAFGFGGNTGLSMWDRLFNTQKAQNYDRYGSSTNLGSNKAPDYGNKLRYSKPDLRPPAKARGGLIPSFASGGENKEAIPALLMGGEYVIHPEAVKYYGKDFFDKVNKGQIPTRESSGEKTKPKFINKIERELNSLAEGSSGQEPLNRIYKRSISPRKNIIGAGLNVMSDGMGGVRQPSPKGIIGAGLNLMSQGTGGTRPPRGSSIVKRAKGSPLGGEKDNVPALLMEGEYVINKDAVNSYGSSFFDKLNSGSIPKFAEGGMVGLPESRLGIAEEDKRYPSMADFRVDAKPVETSVNDNTSIVNNVNININVSPGQPAQSSIAVDSPIVTGPSNTGPSLNAEINKNKNMAEKIRTEVLKIINEQQRIGGLLRK